jgi:hypothetical protein
MKQRATAAEHLLDGKLHPQVEQEQHQPESGQHGEVLGLLDEHRARCPGAEEDTDHHVTGDARETDATA